MYFKQSLFQIKFGNMVSEKLLHSIQDEIRELLPALESFMDEHVSPGAEECERLKTRLRALSDQLAIYHHYRTQQEITPSFELHARVSEVAAAEAELKAIQSEMKHHVVAPPAPIATAPPAPVETPPAPAPPAPPSVTETSKNATPPVDAPSPAASKSSSALAIGLNDKFRFINELFGQNGKEFSLAIEQINSITNKAECEVYLNNLKSLYHWDEQKETVKHFLQLVRNRYS